MRRSGRRVVEALALALVLSATACGTRMSHRDVVAAARGSDSDAATRADAADEAASEQSGQDLVAVEPGASDGGAIDVTTGGAANEARRGGATSAGQDRAGQNGSLPGAGGPASGSTINIGSVGNLSGPAGAAQAPGPAAVQAWVRMINDRGGLGGHPVKLLVADDGGDPARYQAALKTMVEQHKVIAFVGNMAGLTIAAGKAYLEERRVPLVGGDLSAPVWNESPMMFPQGASARTQIWGIAVNLASTGKKRFASVTCYEAQGCREADRLWSTRDWARAAGLEPVYRAQASIAQPDYTAECLAAQSAGAEVIGIVLDAASVQRFARACARQNYRPTFATAGLAVENKLATENANGNLNGLLVTLTTFPWVLRDTPATAEFADALARYAPNVRLSGGASQGWTSAKLFEKALSHAGREITREKLFEGLWRIQNETLGGLTAGVSFRRNAPNPESVCWFPMAVQGTGWRTPSGRDPVCKQHPAA